MSNRVICQGLTGSFYSPEISMTLELRTSFSTNIVMFDGAPLARDLNVLIFNIKRDWCRIGESKVQVSFVINYKGDNSAVPLSPDDT